MITKILAAKRAARSGAHTVIASGHERDVLLRLLQGESIGTLLTAPTLTLAARKQWLADHLQVAGKLVLDAGAIKALRSEGKSLLPIGVKNVLGEDGNEVARGLTNYNAEEARLIAMHPSKEIESLLGYGGDAEIIHRDNMVLL
jgi:glutamate 5-kinase